MTIFRTVAVIPKSGKSMSCSLSLQLVGGSTREGFVSAERSSLIKDYAIRVPGLSYRNSIVITGFYQRTIAFEGNYSVARIVLDLRWDGG